MPDSNRSKADLHVHSKYSDRPSEWFLRRIGAPECFVEPLEIYDRARQKGMDFVTITDHNCIRGALDIAHLPGTFLSVEATTYFPEDGCKIHLLIWGIDEEQFSEIQKLRNDIYQLRDYLTEQDILCAVAHPLFRVNGRLTIDHVEKLLLMFHRFEAMNGARDDAGSELFHSIASRLGPDDIAEMSDRHGINPCGIEPWKISVTGGSDDHSGIYIASAHTTAPCAADSAEFLEYLRQGKSRAAGSCGSSVLMGHSLYHIAYSYYKNRILQNESGKPTIIGELFKKLLERTVEPPSSYGFGRKVRDLATGFLWKREIKKLSDVEQFLVADFSRIFAEPSCDSTTPALGERQTFQRACQITHILGHNFLGRFMEFVRQGRFMESLQSIAALGPIAMSTAPYWAAFSAQHKDKPFLEAVAARFHEETAWKGKAWITDTYTEVNGVSRTIQTLAALARTMHRQLTVITCAEAIPPGEADVENFPPVGTFPMPEYESQVLPFPPFMEVIEYIEQRRFDELIISTPGPMGLVGLAAARLLGLRTVGIYHTDFVEYVRHLTQDDDLADLTWKYILWFYEQMDTVFVPTKHYRELLVHQGFTATKLKVLAHGVDSQFFHPRKRDSSFFRAFGLEEIFKFIYVGRISKEKNLTGLLHGFKRFLKRGQNAHLIVVGEGPYRKELQALCRDLPVLFTGLLEGEKLATAYASADAMIFPSNTDTFGNVVLEAQASGLPVIVSDCGGPAEIARESESAIIVDASQTEILADAMELIYSSTEKQSLLRERGLRNARSNSWEQVLDDLCPMGKSPVTAAEIDDYRFSQHLYMPGVIALDLA